MKVLFINRMMGVSWGGGENYDYHLARALMRRGHEVTFFTGTCEGSDSRPPGDIDCVSLNTPYLRRYMYRVAGKVPILPGLLAEADLRIFLERSKQTLSGLIRHRGIDVAQILALPYLAQWLVPRIPATMRFPGPPAWFQSGLLRRLGRTKRFRMFTHGDAVRYFEQRLQTPVDNVPPGINRDLFHRPSEEERAKARAALGIKPDQFALTTVGRLIPGKGHEFLLRALSGASAPNAQLLIGGDGPLRSRFQRMAEGHGLGDRVRFLGHLRPDGVAELLRSSDAFCLLSSYENYSNAALEAMATGLPVIASDRGGFPQQIREGKNGHLIAYDDDEALRRRVRDLIMQPERRRRMALEAERFAEGFSWDAAARQVEGIYAGLKH